MSEVYVVAVRSDGSAVHYAFQTEMRSASPAAGGGWVGDGQGVWRRAGTDANIRHDLQLWEEHWLQLDGLTMVSWRRLTAQEHDLFGQDRQHRDALEDANGTIKHNMPKARELHRQLLRHQGIEKLLVLDGKWNRANGQGKQAEADAVEAERQTIRDVFDDPRIEAAQSVADLKRVTVP